MMLFRQTLWKFWEDDDYIKLDFSTKTLHIHIINLTDFGKEFFFFFLHEI